MGNRDHLTDALVTSLPPGSKQYYVWDKKTCGFGVLIGATGTRAFVGKINHPGKGSRWLTLQAKTTEAARVEYAAHLVADPQAVNRWRGHIADRDGRK